MQLGTTIQQQLDEKLKRKNSKTDFLHTSLLLLIACPPIQPQSTFILH